MTRNQDQMAHKVAQAAGSAVEKRGYATAIDVFIGLGWLSAVDVEGWRRGQVPYLERAIGANLHKISLAMREFRAWAVKARLKPSRTVYCRHGMGPKATLRFSKSGAPGIEGAYQTHYVLGRQGPS